MSAHPITESEYVTSADPDHCARCGGALQILGALGNLMHFRCRNCGAEQSAGISAAKQERIARLRAQFERGNYERS